MHGTLPAYGFYCRHGRNISFNNIELGYDKPEARPAFVFDDAEGLQLTGIKARTDHCSTCHSIQQSKKCHYPVMHSL